MILMILTILALGGEVKTVTVVELFTSQGCSSCPPADALLADLQNDGSVLALSFHVDYWNYLGWKDPYSSKSYTRLQRKYAKRIGVGVYTPQMVVNGKWAFVGSDRAEAVRRIGDAKPYQIQIHLESELQEKGKLEVSYRIEGGAEKDLAVNLALVSPLLKNRVSRGENRGRSLGHRNVVRHFQSLKVGKDKTGRVVLKPDAQLVGEELRLVGYVFQTGNLEIVGGVALEKTILLQ